MKRLIPVLCLLFSVFWASARSAEVVDLGSDLGYLRVHSIVQERQALAAARAQPHSLVLDLRYPADERDAGDILRAALGGTAGPHRLYVLVSPATPVPVVGAIAANAAHLITLGVKGARPEPQVAVLQTAADDRRAYDALAGKTPLADLISGKIEKERYDEASLVQEFKNGVTDPKPPESLSRDAGRATDPGPTAVGNRVPGTQAETPARLTDRVLQRAVHLHRAFQALKR